MKACGYDEQNMEWNLEEDNHIRRYLLDDATQDERRQVEARLMEDDSYGEWLLVIEDELIDDYAHGRLSELERELFARNFLVTPRRRRDLVVAQEVTKHVAGLAAAGGVTGRKIETAADGQTIDNATQQARVNGLKLQRWRQAGSWWRKLFDPEWLAWKVAASALLILGLVVGGPWLWRGEPELKQAMAALNRAYSAQRPLKTRITSFDYAPFLEVRGEEKDKTDYIALHRAEEMLEAQARRPSALTQHALGRLYLAEKDFDQARRLFDAALQSAPNNAQLYSDLGAALFEHWNQQYSAGRAAESEQLRNLSLKYLTKALECCTRLRGRHNWRAKNGGNIWPPTRTPVGLWKRKGSLIICKRRVEGVTP
jgi:tetratricopeptide (TPR) repeat protein